MENQYIQTSCLCQICSLLKQNSLEDINSRWKIFLLFMSTSSVYILRVVWYSFSGAIFKEVIYTCIKYIFMEWLIFEKASAYNEKNI